jgi:hypothetical protein
VPVVGCSRCDRPTKGHWAPAGGAEPGPGEAGNRPSWPETNIAGENGVSVGFTRWLLDQPSLLQE